MEGLKSWNKKSAGDKTFANLKLHMRSEYLALHEVGGLTINGTMNHASLVRELKTHQKQVSDNLKRELKANLMQKLQAFSMTEDNENMDQHLSSYGHSTNKMYHDMIANKGKVLVATIQPHVDPLVAQMKKQIKLLQSQLGMLSKKKMKVED